MKSAWVLGEQGALQKLYLTKLFLTKLYLIQDEDDVKKRSSQMMETMKYCVSPLLSSKASYEVNPLQRMYSSISAKDMCACYCECCFVCVLCC